MQVKPVQHGKIKLDTFGHAKSFLRLLSKAHPAIRQAFHLRHSPVYELPALTGYSAEAPPSKSFVCKLGPLPGDKMEA